MKNSLTIEDIYLLSYKLKVICHRRNSEENFDSPHLLHSVVVNSHFYTINEYIDPKNSLCHDMKKYIVDIMGPYLGADYRQVNVPSVGSSA